MQTFAIIDGDLVLAANGFLTLTGPNKVKQDLYFALHESYGADPYHPGWGSVLDRYLGRPLTVAIEQGVYNEVIRVVNNYMAVQADTINASTAGGTRSLLNTSDVVREIESAEVIRLGPNALVNVQLSTMAGQRVSVQRLAG